MANSLCSLLSRYPDFIFHDLFLSELSRLLKKELSGHEKEFTTVLLRQFHYIDSFRSHVNKTDRNEKLKYANGAYSIHLKMKFFNVRFLIHVTPDDKNVYFLSAFYEREGKGKTSYDEYIPILKRRLQELM